MYGHQITKKKIALLSFFVVLLFFPLISMAHGDGSSYEKEIDGYLVDIGYSPENPYTNGSVSFDFGLSKDETPADFSDLWVRISKDGHTIFAGGIHNSNFGGARLSVVFPEEGEYTVSARYQNENEEVVSAEFPLTIYPNNDGSSFDFGFNDFLYILLGVIVGALGIKLIKK